MSGTFRLLKAFAAALTSSTILSSACSAEGVLVCGRRTADGVEVCALSYNHPTAADAANGGLAQCAAAGLLNCRIPATFRKSCYAYAFAQWGGAWGANGGDDAASAESAALAICRRYSAGAPCIAHATVCDSIDEQDMLRAEEERRRQEAEALAQAAEAERERAEDERAEREEWQRRRQAELQREREEQRRREDDERAADADRRKRASEAELCLTGDINACNSLLNNPRLTTTERPRIEAKRRELVFKDQTKTAEPPQIPQAAPTKIIPTPDLPKTASRTEPRPETTPSPTLQQPASLVRSATQPASTAFTNFSWTLAAISAIALLVLAVLGITALPYDAKNPRYADRFKNQWRTAFAIDAIVAAYKSIRDLPSVIRYKIFPRDTPRALSAMELAHAFLTELEEEELVGASEELQTLSLAARQIRNAEWFDPDALITVSAEEDVPLTLTLSKLKARALLAEAKIRVIRDQPNRAATCLKHAIRLSPKDPHLHYSLGVVLIDLAQKRQAITTLKTAVQLQPSDIEYRKALDRARHISRSAKAVRDAGSTLRGFVALVRYGLFGLLAWLLYAYILAPGWVAGQAPNPNPSLWELLNALLVYGILCFLIIVVPFLLLRKFIGWVIGATAADIYTGITNPFRRK